MAISEQLRIVRVATRLVDEARETVPAYAARRHVQAGTHHIAELLGAYECHVTYQDLPPGVEGIALPAVANTYPIILRDDGMVSRDIQERHELAHVIAGDVGEEPVYLADGERDFGERVADLFALADIIPSGWIAYRRGMGAAWREIVVEATHWVSVEAPGWGRWRCRDRARLRLLMFRTQGI